MNKTIGRFEHFYKVEKKSKQKKTINYKTAGNFKLIQLATSYKFQATM